MTAPPPPPATATLDASDVDGTTAPFTPVTLEVEPFSFELPPELEATEPAEARGMTRDAVRLMVAHRDTGEIEHTVFSDLPRHLEAPDIVVVNTSGTLAAELDGAAPGGRDVLVHLSTQLPNGQWSVELRSADGPLLDEQVGEVIALPAGATLTLVAPYGRGPAGRHPRGTRLWVTDLDVGGLPLHTYLAVNGRPIRYGYVRGSWPLSAYQNVYATEPGSAEMPSAGRPFTPEILMRLVAKGVEVAPVLLHTGVASLEASEPPYPEYFEVSDHIARRINGARAAGGRVIAIGTTVVRTLESAADPADGGRLHAARGYTERVVTPQQPPIAIDGLLTGWHEPEASHLALLESVAGRDLLEASYREALAEGYRWHEFGDVHLVLP
jgi:S-adenosylmethionine:tRNA ribosyltransferase-isomerase